MSDVVHQFYQENPFPNDPSVVPHVETYLRRICGRQQPRRILMVGCGTGEELIAARHVFPAAHITGIEPSAASLNGLKLSGFGAAWNR